MNNPRKIKENKVESLQQAIIFLSNKKDQANRYITQTLSFNDVYCAAVNNHKTFSDNNFWEPTKLLKDKHAPSSYDANLTMVINELTANMITQSTTQSRVTDLEMRLRRTERARKKKSTISTMMATMIIQSTVFLS